MESMQAPNTRAEFERNFHLFHRKFEAGEIKFSSQVVRSLEGLARVRVLPNGRVDFLSVDETARLQANMMANMLANHEPSIQPPPAGEDTEAGAVSNQAGEEPT